ncbi:two-component system response regulator [Terasakiispira papahanaumokuakeensis]|uniref:Two-component system response regulator n=1 Tax=Terasakiispira papahanaumokuakeensis TaxID=197479 RepID=A0A1E2V8D6_9GAMM|nr:response regulator [Terasakiispira papahanaumokuakeensis]ODC03279.1 two-component system response regulator [Terasakiispira papahanaumokuakeensis]
MAKQILVVDDSASVRQVVSMTLKNAGHQVVEAVDGRDALNKLDSHRFNLVISDVNMPNMDGISFIKEMKKKSDYRFTPVLMLTTESEASKKAEGKAAGAKAWLVKPFKPDVLLSAVSKLA